MTKAEKQAAEYAAETDTPKTVRVRIAVAIDGDRHWAAYSWGTGDQLGQSVAETLATVTEMMSDHEDSEIRWVEADIPLPPPPQTIQGAVVNGP